MRVSTALTGNSARRAQSALGHLLLSSTENHSHNCLSWNTENAEHRSAGALVVPIVMKISVCYLLKCATTRLLQRQMFDSSRTRRPDIPLARLRFGCQMRTLAAGCCLDVVIQVRPVQTCLLRLTHTDQSRCQPKVLMLKTQTRRRRFSRIALRDARVCVDHSCNALVLSSCFRVALISTFKAFVVIV